jgi:hypothetical protein
VIFQGVSRVIPWHSSIDYRHLPRIDHQPSRANTPPTRRKACYIVRSPAVRLYLYLRPTRVQGAPACCARREALKEMLDAKV